MVDTRLGVDEPRGRVEFRIVRAYVEFVDSSILDESREFADRVRPVAVLAIVRDRDPEWFRLIK